MKKYLSIFIFLTLCIESVFACEIVNKNGKKILKDRTIIKLCPIIIYGENNKKCRVCLHINSHKYNCSQKSYQKYKKIIGTFNELEQQLNYKDKLILSKHYNQHKFADDKKQQKERFWKTESSGMIHKRGCRWYGKSKGKYTKEKKGKRCYFCF